MDSIITKLSEIETTAAAIVAHAEEEKEQLDKAMQEKQAQFDLELAASTQQKLNIIQNTFASDMETQLAQLKTANEASIRALTNEYNTKHELYAQEILKRITEV